MILEYFVLLSIAIFSAGLAGMASSRHFLIMLLSAEVALTAPSLLVVAFFYYGMKGNVLAFLIALWSVASAEVIAIVVFYRFMSKAEASLDVSKLSNLKG